MSTENKSVATTQKSIQEETVNAVLGRINTFKSTGELRLPKDYSPENAIKAAWLILLDHDKKPLENCTKESICNALLKMVVMGLSPLKKQCDFIPYGNILKCTEEYTGNIALAKRYGNVKDVKPVTIYEGDEFEYEINGDTGRRRVTKHKQDLDNIDHTKVKGAYAVVIFNDNSTDVTVMNISQIRKAWEQGPMKGKSGAHINFTDEMANKTVINRACKLLIRSSDDSPLMLKDENEETGDPVVANVQNQIKEKANKEIISFDEAEPADEPTQEPEVKQQNGQVEMTGPGY